jgi:hypothetical protein
MEACFAIKYSQLLPRKENELSLSICVVIPQGKKHIREAVKMSPVVSIIEIDVNNGK